MFKIMNKLKSKKGFTLIELIVVLAVLAIIMAIAVPRFLGVQEQAKRDADYATGGTIAKAAELYLAQNETSGTLDSNLSDAQETAILATLGTPKFQSTKIAGTINNANLNIAVDPTGNITVSAIDSTPTTYILFPKPTTDVLK